MSADTDTSTFPRSARLRSPREFQAAFSQGRRINAAFFRLHVRFAERHKAESTQQPIDAAVILQTSISSAVPPIVKPNDVRKARLGISVSKRVSAHAVERNRIKRVARDSFRRCRTRLPCGDYVLLAQRESAAAPSAALREALLSLWKRAIALKPIASAPTMPPRAGVDGESL